MKPAAFFALALRLLGARQPRPGSDRRRGRRQHRCSAAPDGGAAYLRGHERRRPARAAAAREVGSGAADRDRATRRQIKALLPVAAVRGVNVAFSVQPARTRPPSPRRPSAASRFVAFSSSSSHDVPDRAGHHRRQRAESAVLLAAAVRRVGQERLRGVRTRRCSRSSYDALKAVDPEINVIGLGLSSRGNDDPGASGNVSTSPVKFLEGVGAAYRASGRTRPLMDELAYHPYPRRDTDSLTEGYPVAERRRHEPGPRSNRRSGTRSTARRSRPSRTAFGFDSTRWAGRSRCRADRPTLLLRRRDGEADDRGHAGGDLRLARSLRGL